MEILVAVVLLVIGVLAIVESLSAGMNAEADVGARTTALVLAQEAMENVRNASSYAGVSSYASPRSTLTGDFSAFQREVLVSGNPLQVTVNVYWSVKNAAQQVTLTTLFADYVHT